MGVVSKAGDWTFKAFTAGLGLTTIYLAATFSVNVYRGLSWHNAQSIVSKITKLEGCVFRERVVSKAGDWTFKAFTAGLGLTTIYLAATFSVNVYRDLSWHNAQSKIDKDGSDNKNL